MPKAGEPTWNTKMTNTELATALNWYHINRSDIDARRYLYEYAVKAIEATLTVNDVSRWNFLVVDGWISRLLSRGIELPDIKMKRGHNAQIRKMIKSDEDLKTTTKTKPVKRVCQIPEEDSGILGELEFQVDQFIKGSCKTNFDIKKWLVAKEVKQKDAYSIKQWAKPTVKHYNEVLDQKLENKQLKEAYSNFSRPELKRLQKFYQELYDEANSYFKTSRKPRKKTVKDSETQASLEAHLTDL